MPHGSTGLAAYGSRQGSCAKGSKRSFPAPRVPPHTVGLAGNWFRSTRVICIFDCGERLPQLSLPEHAWIDSSQAPLLSFSGPAHPMVAEMARLCTVLEAWYEKVGAPFVHVMDLRALRECDGALRVRVVRHLKDTAGIVAPLHAGTALVIGSPWVRLMVKGVILLAPAASPVTVHDIWAKAQGAGLGLRPNVMPSAGKVRVTAEGGVAAPALSRRLGLSRSS